MPGVDRLSNVSKQKAKASHHNDNQQEQVGKLGNFLKGYGQHQPPLIIGLMYCVTMVLPQFGILTSWLFSTVEKSTLFQDEVHGVVIGIVVDNQRAVFIKDGGKLLVAGKNGAQLLIQIVVVVDCHKVPQFIQIL